MEGRRRVKVVYGTQTGCAREVAEYIEDELRRMGCGTDMEAMDECEGKGLSAERAVVCVISTQGDGEMPDNAKRLWRFLLQKSLPSDWLSGVAVGVFGLGDSSYAKFNFAAKKLYRRLCALGADMVVERGDGDDQHPLGLDGALDVWLASLKLQLVRLGLAAPLSSDGMGMRSRFSVHSLPTANGPPPQHLFPGHSSPQSLIFNPSSPSVEYGLHRPLIATVLRNDRVTAVEWDQDVRHITFDTMNSGMTYSPGDVLSVLPSNLREDALSFLNRLELDPNIVLTSITPVDNHDKRWTHIPFPISLVDMMTHYVDFQGHPRRLFFKNISYLTENDLEKEKLTHFASAEGQGDLRLYNQKEGRTYYEVLSDFRHVRVSLEHVFTVLPPLRPRRFSICSSLSHSPRSVEILVAVVKYTTPLKRIRVGLCSHWLSTCPPSSQVRVFFEKGTISLPQLTANVIAVGPGTGTLNPMYSYSDSC